MVLYTLKLDPMRLLFYATDHLSHQKSATSQIHFDVLFKRYFIHFGNRLSKKIISSRGTLLFSGTQFEKLCFKGKFKNMGKSIPNVPAVSNLLYFLNNWLRLIFILDLNWGNISSYFFKIEI
jgi:hypothetical protein